MFFEVTIFGVGYCIGDRLVGLCKPALHTGYPNVPTQTGNKQCAHWTITHVR